MNFRMTKWFAAFFVASATTMASGAEIQLFERPDMQGQRFVIHDDVSNLDHTGFNDKTSSIVVRDGTWEACVDADFQGGCITLAPGEYRQLDRGYDRRISSVRRVADVQGGRDERHVQGYAGPDSPSARAVLFEGPNFQGRSFQIGGDTVRNLDRTGFNDRARSLQVSGGYWIFCSDAEFEGDCQTFGPGDYRDLPGALDRRISSGRRVSNQYPYQQQPVWSR